jgi:hypothetical protein
MNEYVGCKVERGIAFVKLTQPILIRSLTDEFNLPDGRAPNTPAEPGTVLPEAKEQCIPNATYYRKGVGKLIHLVRWSRPDVWNSVRGLSRHMSKPNNKHVDAMHRVMKYLVAMKDKGLYIQPNQKWNGIDKDFEFIIEGKADADYAKSHDRKNVSGWCTTLCGAPVTEKSSTQQSTTLSVTESELVAGTECAQDMLYIKKVLESMNLKVKLPMILHIDNKGVVDFTQSWSTGGRMRHVDCRYYFLRDLREAGIIQVIWINSTSNEADLYTKNLDCNTYHKHASMRIK